MNESDSLFIPTYNRIFCVNINRRYDIEYRVKYFVTYDETNETYIINEVKVPMMFIQEKNIGTFAEDILNGNSINALISLNEAHLNKIISDYDTLIDIFKTNKDLVTSQIIVNYINGTVEE